MLGRQYYLYIYMITLGPQSYETFPTKVGFVFDTSYGWWPGIYVRERERERDYTYGWISLWQE